MKNKDKMQQESNLLTKNLSINLMRKRNLLDEDYNEPQNLDRLSTDLTYHGGYFQQNRMIRDKQQSLEKALLYSYQGAFVRKLQSDDTFGESVRALINPNKITQDYDDKKISISFENEFVPGDVFEWIGTNTYWLIYLQELSEIAYFRGSIRKCRYNITWKDENGQIKSTYAAVRGPVETKINDGQKHGIILNEPNYSLNILMPKNKDTLKQFKRYSKFYLSDIDGEDPICWRVEARDEISMPGVLEVVAVEYYQNENKDDIENRVVGGLIPEQINPNSNEIEELIVGETFIKPNIFYQYHFTGDLESQWGVNKEKLPIKVEHIDQHTIKLKWIASYSGQFVLSYGDYEKTIVIESLF